MIYRISEGKIEEIQTALYLKAPARIPISGCTSIPSPETGPIHSRFTRLENSQNSETCNGLRTKRHHPDPALTAAVAIGYSALGPAASSGDGAKATSSPGKKKSKRKSPSALTATAEMLSDLVQHRQNPKITFEHTGLEDEVPAASAAKPYAASIKGEGQILKEVGHHHRSSASASPAAGDEGSTLPGMRATSLRSGIVEPLGILSSARSSLAFFTPLCLLALVSRWRLVIRFPRRGFFSWIFFVTFFRSLFGGCAVHAGYAVYGVRGLYGAGDGKWESQRDCRAPRTAGWKERKYEGGCDYRSMLHTVPSSPTHPASGIRCAVTDRAFWVACSRHALPPLAAFDLTCPCMLPASSPGHPSRASCVPYPPLLPPRVLLLHVDTHLGTRGQGDEEDTRATLAALAAADAANAADTVAESTRPQDARRPHPVDAAAVAGYSGTEAREERKGRGQGQAGERREWPEKEAMKRSLRRRVQPSQLSSRSTCTIGARGAESGGGVGDREDDEMRVVLAATGQREGGRGGVGDREDDETRAAVTVFVAADRASSSSSICAGGPEGESPAEARRARAKTGGEGEGGGVGFDGGEGEELGGADEGKAFSSFRMWHARSGVSGLAPLVVPGVGWRDLEIMCSGLASRPRCGVVARVIGVWRGAWLDGRCDAWGTMEVHGMREWSA
ncbi:hypothetical protein C8R45DRAFT_947297 [Mycena sanguinolenta]|nr:hypothetical protein C8R45DRAFT_947297 [Mycena sanguinolenta]